MPDSDGRVRIGISGTARIASATLIKPAKQCDEIAVVVRSVVCGRKVFTESVDELSARVLATPTREVDHGH